VAWVSALEQKLDRRLPPERLGAYAAILNALEYQVEEGQGDPCVVRHLGEALLALAVAHQLEVALVKDITQTLGLLHGHVSSRPRPPSTR
jgi:hypothetical protein